MGRLEYIRKDWESVITGWNGLGKVGNRSVQVRMDLKGFVRVGMVLKGFVRVGMDLKGFGTGLCWFEYHRRCFELVNLGKASFWDC